MMALLTAQSSVHWTDRAAQILVHFCGLDRLLADAARAAGGLAREPEREASSAPQLGASHPDLTITVGYVRLIKQKQYSSKLPLAS